MSSLFTCKVHHIPAAKEESEHVVADAVGWRSSQFVCLRTPRGSEVVKALGSGRHGRFG